MFPLRHGVLDGRAQRGSVGRFLSGDLEGDREGDGFLGNITSDLDVDGLFLCQGRDYGVVDLTRGLRGGADFHNLGDDMREHIDLLAAMDFALWEAGKKGRKVIDEWTTPHHGIQREERQTYCGTMRYFYMIYPFQYYCFLRSFLSSLPASPAFTDGMVQDSVRGVIIAVGSPADEDQGQIVRIRPGNSIDRAQTTHCVGHHHGRHTLFPGASVSGVTEGREGI